MGQSIVIHGIIKKRGEIAGQQNGPRVSADAIRQSGSDRPRLAALQKFGQFGLEAALRFRRLNGRFPKPRASQLDPCDLDQDSFAQLPVT